MAKVQGDAGKVTRAKDNYDLSHKLIQDFEAAAKEGAAGFAKHKNSLRKWFQYIGVYAQQTTLIKKPEWKVAKDPLSTDEYKNIMRSLKFALNALRASHKKDVGVVQAKLDKGQGQGAASPKDNFSFKYAGSKEIREDLGRLFGSPTLRAALKEHLKFVGEDKQEKAQGPALILGRQTWFYDHILEPFITKDANEILTDMTSLLKVVEEEGVKTTADVEGKAKDLAQKFDKFIYEVIEKYPDIPSKAASAVKASAPEADWTPGAKGLLLFAIQEKLNEALEPLLKGFYDSKIKAMSDKLYITICGFNNTGQRTLETITLH